MFVCVQNCRALILIYYKILITVVTIMYRCSCTCTRAQARVHALLIHARTYPKACDRKMDTHSGSVVDRRAYGLEALL